MARLKEASWEGGLGLPRGRWGLTQVTPVDDFGQVVVIVDNETDLRGEDCEGLLLTMTPLEARKLAVQLWRASAPERTCIPEVDPSSPLGRLLADIASKDAKRSLP
jgi:hypothetical protein